jgi:hypothetical protein
MFHHVLFGCLEVLWWPGGGGRTRFNEFHCLRRKVGTSVVDWLVRWLISSGDWADCGQMHVPRNNHSISATNFRVFMALSPNAAANIGAAE